MSDQNQRHPYRLGVILLTCYVFFVAAVTIFVAI